MAYLYRNTVAGSSTKFTLSFWIKRGDNDTDIHQIWSLGSQTGADGFIQLRFNDDNGGGTFRISAADGNGDSLNLFSLKKLMDSQWYHFVLRVEMGNSSANKVRAYMNGTEIEWDSTPSYDLWAASSLASTFWTGGNSNVNTINAARDGSQQGDHHFSEIYFVDGQDLVASTFAETDSNGRWTAKSPSTVRASINSTGTFGANGYYLPFKDDTSTTTLLHDYQTSDRSGTTNDFTLSGTLVGGTNNRTLSGPDNDFAIMNEMHRDYFGWDFDNGGLKIATNDTGTLQISCMASIALPRSGKWYYEVRLNELSTTSSGGTGNSFGFSTSGEREFVRWQYSHNGSANGNTIADSVSGTLQTIGSGGGTGYPNAGDIYGFAADIDNGTFTVYRNNTQIGSVNYDFKANTGRYLPYFRNDEGVSGRGSDSEWNFGQGYWVTSNSNNGYSDDNGYGRFQYQPPTGYQSICYANIPNPTVVPSEHFNIVKYDGNSSDNRAITLGFQPDLILSRRSQNTASWYWIDSVRGVTHPLTQGTGTQGTETSQVKSFTSTGVTVGTDSNINGSGTNGYIMAGWKGGGSSVTNNDGSVSSTVSANTSAGFSVVQYTVPSGDYTVGHGLDRKPDLIILRGGYSTNTYNYDVYTPNNGGTGGAGHRLKLNSADLRETTANAFKNEPTDTVFSQNSAHYSVGNVNIAWCWHAVEGLSDFGYFNGASNTHIFINTGFAPKIVVVKPYNGNSTPGTGWRFFDRTRNVNNNQGTDDALYMNTTGNQVGQNGVDMHSNGFSVYGEGDNNLNASGMHYFYMAFAELPAEFARGIG
jgi:hypothetical protein